MTGDRDHKPDLIEEAAQAAWRALLDLSIEQ
jgi:hypothetical protein